jgi:hypothetical protein
MVTMLRMFCCCFLLSFSWGWMSGSAHAEMLIVTSSPKATIFINGIRRGLTPVRLRATPGSYRIELRQRGYQTWTQVIVVPPQSTTRFDIQLKASGGQPLAVGSIQPLRPSTPKPAARPTATGLVYLLSTPAGATVLHQGKNIGRTPLLTQLPLGVQTLTVQKKGFAPLQRFVTVGQRMQRLSVALRVDKSGRSQPLPAANTNGNIGNSSPPLARGTGQLLIFSRPSATVTFDGKSLGQTPLVSAGFSPGRYLLVLRKKGYRVYRRWLVLSAGQSIRINALLIPNRRR